MLAVRISIVAVMLVLAAGCSAETLSAGTPAPSARSSTAVAPTTSPSTTAETTTTPTSSTSASPGAGIGGFVALIETMASRDEFSGAALIGHGEDVVWETAAGLANRELNLPNLSDTRFNLGSMNKMFTAVAILQLREQGQLALDDTIAAYLPDYPNDEVAGSITIHQLLTHTSGLGDVFTAEFNADPHAYRSNRDYLPLFADAPLLFDPGAGWSYSNAGYVVLGLIIERISGRTYDAYVREHIFEPSGMLSTSAYDIDEEIPNLAIGYTTQDAEGNETGVLTANTALMPGRGFAAGGGYSTTGDLFRFRNALLSNKLLNPSSIDLLTTGKADMAEGVRYAYGFMDKVNKGRRVVGHSGGAPGVCSFFWIFPESGYTAILLSNSDGGCRSVLQYLKDNPLE